MPDQNTEVAHGLPTVNTEPRLTPLAAFERFYLRSYRPLVAAVMAAGANQHEAEDAVSEAMRDLLSRPSDIKAPFAYVKRASLRFFIKARTRDRERVLREQLYASPGSHARAEDSQLNVWEDVRWVGDFLRELAPEQRTVLALVYDQFSPSEIALILGKTPAAVRQNLLAARRRAKAALTASRPEAAGGASGDLSGSGRQNGPGRRSNGSDRPTARHATGRRSTDPPAPPTTAQQHHEAPPPEPGSTSASTASITSVGKETP